LDPRGGHLSEKLRHFVILKDFCALGLELSIVCLKSRAVSDAFLLAKIR